MNREQFNKMVMIKYHAFEEEKLGMTKIQIYNDAYDIAKMTSLKDFLTEYDCFDMELLYPHAETILNDLYEFECGYDTPQWGNLDNIEEMINLYLSEKENEND